MRPKRAFLLLFCTVFAIRAAVTKIEVIERSGVQGGYEQLKGRVHFAVNPGARVNRGITDLMLAARDDRGQVRFSADFVILRPVEPRNANRTLLFEVVNRGKRGMSGTFNKGDDLLFRQGYTLAWVGWQHDVPESADLLRIDVPRAQGVSGWVRGEFTPAEPTHFLPLGDAGHIPYQPDPSVPIRLSVRQDVYGSRTAIPRDAWELQGTTGIRLKEPAAPGHIYDFIYRSADPPIAGLGLAAIRDFVSELKRRGDADRAIGFGVSQSAMVLRAFVYEGFNEDETGHRVFDGILSHVAGSRRSTFQRFAQPSRTAGPLRNASLSPTEQFPFADVEQTDAFTGVRDGILRRASAAKVVPKIIYTNSSYEYWGSAASLLHTTPDGTRDAPLPATTRLYLFAGGQHGPASFPPRAGRGQNLPNFNDYTWALRALLGHLQRWIVAGTEPPPSLYPTIRDRTLVRRAAYRFPALPNISAPENIHTPHHLDFSTEPPKVGGAYTVLVPQADGDGHDIAGIRMPVLECPTGTFTGWNRRSAAAGATDYLLSNTGSWIPLLLTSGSDPRRALLERYADENAFGACIERASESLVKHGFILPQDIPAIQKAALRQWQWSVSERAIKTSARQ